jgi:DNA-directed RNA polymerase subunit M/transcription elongation factor TFIIS
MDNSTPTTLMQAVTAYLNTLVQPSASSSAVGVPTRLPSGGRQRQAKLPGNFRERALGKEERAHAGPSLLHLARWYGGERELRALSPADVERYRIHRAEHGDRAGKLDPLRGFFVFVEREEMTEHSLAAALRSGRQSSRPTGGASTGARSKNGPRPQSGPSLERSESSARTDELRAGAPSSRADLSGRAGDIDRSSIQCPACGEDEALRGDRRADAIAVTCQRCGHNWERPLRPACPRCGRTDLVATSEPLVERVRGNQTAIVGARAVYRCPTCDR